tara:strand:- start:888 stop:1820 length:933 start_codon:yes stop_codon:yes gene_type:complete
MNHSEMALRINDLNKIFPPDIEALKSVSLEIEKGDFFGLLGPNGAGKSTLIGIICGLVNKTRGEVKVHGIDLDTDPYLMRKQIGVVPQEFNFNIFETCFQIVSNQGGFYGMEKSPARERSKTLLSLLGLEDKMHTPSGQLSGGMKRRLMIARALVHGPKVLVLDEPTAGVDISLRRSMWDFMLKQNQEGLTIILTTHYLEEAESLCKKIAIIDEGNIIENGTTQSLLQKLKKETYVCYCEAFQPKEMTFPFDFRVINQKIIEVDLKESDILGDVLSTLSSSGIKVKRIKNKVNRLEELFVNLVEGSKTHD